MRAAAYDQSCSSEIRSSRSVRAIMSNDAKCRWSCTGVVMPAWCAPKNVVRGCRGIRLGARARPRHRPATPAPAPMRESGRAGADGEPEQPRRDGSATGSEPASSPGSSERRRWVRSHHSRTVTVSCDSGSASALMRSVNSRLSSSVSSRVGHEAVRERSVRGERIPRGRRSRRRSRSTSAAPVVALRRGEVARERERHLRALDVRGEVPEVGARPPVLLAGDLAGGDLVEQRDRAVAQPRDALRRRARPGSRRSARSRRAPRRRRSSWSPNAARSSGVEGAQSCHAGVSPSALSASCAGTQRSFSMRWKPVQSRPSATASTSR